MPLGLSDVFASFLHKKFDFIRKKYYNIYRKLREVGNKMKLCDFCQKVEIEDNVSYCGSCSARIIKMGMLLQSLKVKPEEHPQPLKSALRAALCPPSSQLSCLR